MPNGSQKNYGTLTNVLLCDAVYKDARTNKYVIAGVYSGDIAVGEFPARVPVSFYLEYWPKIEVAVDIELSISVGKKLRAKAKIETESNTPGRPTVLMLPPIELSIEKDSLVYLHASFGEGRKKKILTKRIYKSTE